MNRKQRRARSRTGPGSVVSDTAKALATHKAGAVASALRLRSRYASRATLASAAAGRYLTQAEDQIGLAADGETWRYGKVRDREVIIDRIDVAGDLIEQAYVSLAAEGEALRHVEQIDALLARYGADQPEQGHDGPTPEMLDRLKSRLGDPVERLVDLGRLTEDDLGDLREIAAMVRYATADVRTSMMRFECKSEGDADAARRTAAEAAEWNGLCHAHVYVPWCRTVGPQTVGLVLGLAVEGLSLEQLRRRYGVRWTTALDNARRGLLEYRRLRRRYVRLAA